MNATLTKKQNIALACVITVPALYAAIGFWLVPKLALPMVNEALATKLNIASKVESISLNPFTLELRAHHFTAENGLTFKELYANLQLDSLWRRHLHLKEIRLDGAQLSVLLAKNGQLNVTQWLKTQAGDSPAAENQEPFALSIDQISIEASKIHFRDEQPAHAIDTEFELDTAELMGFSTLPDSEALLNLKIINPQAGTLTAEAKIKSSPWHASGKIQLTDGKLAPFWPYAAPFLNLKLEQGNLTLDGEFEAAFTDTLSLKVKHANLAAGPVVMRDAGNEPLLQLAHASISNIKIDLEKRSLTTGTFSSTGLEAWVNRSVDGSLNWQHVFTGTTASSEGNDQAWQVAVSETQLQEYRLHLVDRSLAEPVSIEVGPLNASAGAINSASSEPVNLKLDTALAQGTLTVSGALVPSPLSGELKLSSSGVDLRIAQPYITPHLYLKLNSGNLNSDLTLTLRSQQPLDFSVTGKLSINELQTLDTLKNRDLLKWTQLDLSGLNYQHNQGLDIERIDLLEPYARFIIAEDRSTNVGDLLKPQAKASGSNPSEKNSAAAPTKPFGIRIGTIAVKDGSAYFSDQSLTPNFKTSLMQLNGQLTDLDNTLNKATPIDFKGRVDRYAPVEISGYSNLFDPLDKLDLTAKFRHVELTTLSPYSGKFAGYRIRRGKLNLDLHYEVKNRELKAENKIVLEQLRLGERVESPDAVDLPIKLAVALMRDNEGKISADIPIQGSLDNPQFKVGPAIWNSLRGLILKIVTSPFSMMANLVGTESKDQLDLSKVKFKPGDDQLDEPAQHALRKLADALHQRPALRLDVEGISNKSQDAPRVAEQQLELAYQRSFYLVLQQRGEKVPAKPESIVVPDEQKPVLLEALYNTSLKQAPPAEWKSLEKSARQQKMAQALISHWSENEPLLRKLAQKRAANIKDYLVQSGKLSEDRIYLLDVNVVDAPNQPVLSALHLDSD